MSDGRHQIFAAEDGEQIDEPLYINGVILHPDGSVEPDSGSKGVRLSDDWYVQYDSANDRLEFHDEENNTTAYLGRNSSGDLLGSSTGGEFTDTNDDGIAVLQAETAADFDAKPARNLAAPSNSSDAARKAEVDAKADATHDHTGDSLNPDRVNNTDYNETVDSASVSGTVGLDLTAANVFDRTLTGDTTFTFDNASADPAGNSFTLLVEQDATGGWVITWPTSVEWHQGTAPDLSTLAGDKHMLSFISPDGGATWIGLVSAEEIA